MVTMKFRKRFNDEENDYYGKLTAVDFSNDPGRTLQEPAIDADINVLMKRMGVQDHSQLPFFAAPMALYGDFSEMPTDPVEIAQAVRAGELAFLRMPASIRTRFHSPEMLYNFMADPQNREEAIELGLIEKPSQTPSVSSSTSSDKEGLVPNSETSNTET